VKNYSQGITLGTSSQVQQDSEASSKTEKDGKWNQVNEAATLVHYITDSGETFYISDEENHGPNLSEYEGSNSGQYHLVYRDGTKRTKTTVDDLGPDAVAEIASPSWDRIGEDLGE
jgi:hypothetical protein